MNKSIEIKSSKDADRIPLAKQIFKLSLVNSVFISANFVSITKHKSFNWEDIVMQIRLYISDYLNSIEVINHTQEMEKDSKKKENIIADKDQINDIEKKISNILDQYMRLGGKAN